ncbi:hypothetical protein HNP11_004158 [Tsukamurella ocularis]|uniref:hypothetical protein n=1 Tax=Tsukamurella ocularis TaxID=1970234 RepID=UPI002169D646|nr:hypothetical protein [Tsukamurella ocularis]MCS3789960.1 hypothetical protein [Tsukamurella ocularis]
MKRTHRAAASFAIIATALLGGACGTDSGAARDTATSSAAPLAAEPNRVACSAAASAAAKLDAGQLPNGWGFDTTPPAVIDARVALVRSTVADLRPQVAGQYPAARAVSRWADQVAVQGDHIAQRVRVDDTPAIGLAWARVEAACTGYGGVTR